MLLKLKSLSLPRVVIAALSALVVATVIASFAGGLDQTFFSPAAMAASLAASLFPSLLSSWLLGLVFSSRPSLESAAISGLILWFLFWPSTAVVDLAWFAGIAVLAQVSKYLIAWRGRHIVNPVAAGVLLAVIIGRVFNIEAVPLPTWWVASQALFWPVLLAGIVVWWRSGRFWMSWIFGIAAGTLIVKSMLDINASFGNPITVFEAITFALHSTPLLFFAAFMLTEPLTMPSRVGPQTVAVLAAIVATLGLTTTALDFEAPSLLIDSSYEWALVLTGLIALLAGQNSARITLRERIELAGDAVEYRWESKRPVRFEPGQYVEVDIAHPRPDARGRRRAFSPISIPGEELVFSTRHPESGSTYKQALLALEPGDTARVTSVHGSFVWPRKGPILLVGAGIGVTPFLSQLAAEPDRDVVVAIGVREEGQPYLEELRRLAPRLIEVPVEELTAEYLESQIDDLDERSAFISGRPEFVQDLRLQLGRVVRKIHTDYFWGS